MTEALDVRNFTAEEKDAAAITRYELDHVLDSIDDQQKQLETDFVKLGVLLTRVQVQKSWLLWDFKSYNKFLESIEPRVHKGRTHLYACSKIAAQLLPHMSEEDLIEVGISKASALATAVKKSGKAPSDELLAKAKDPAITAEKFDQFIGGELGTRDDYEEGIWFSLSGVFFHNEEKDEFVRAMKTACHVDPAMRQEVTNWHDATAGERKEILQRWLREFLGTYEAAVQRGEG